MTKHFCYRKSCFGVELRFRIDPDCAWITVERPGCGRELVEIADKDVDAVKDRFDAIDGDPQRFAEFVSTFAHRHESARNRF